MTDRIQISFQGGGAKIVDLLAAAEAVQEISLDQGIEITRVAGTSAGSIVATLMAQGVRISSLDSSLFETILESVRTAPGIEKLSGDGWLDKGDQLLTIARGHSFIEDGYLKKIINIALEELGISPETAIRDIALPIFIGAASQISRRAEYFNQEDKELCNYSIADALTSSCKIPFVFANFKSDKELSQAYVDGGLCENLPVEPLLAGKADFGPVIAIGVSSKPGSWPAKNAKEYVGQLFDIAINNSVKRAERFVGQENVHHVVSQLNTTDFLSLKSTFRLSENYKRTFESCSTWFQRRVNALTPATPSITYVPSKPTIEELLEQNARSFAARRKGRTFHVEFSALIAAAHSWKQRYEKQAKALGSSDVYSRVHLVPRQRDFELAEYPIGMTAIDGAWAVPPSLNVEIIQANGERRPAEYEIFQYALEGELFGYKKNMVKCVVVLKEPLATSDRQIEGSDADKLLIWYQQKTDVIFKDLLDENEEHDSLGLFATAGVNAIISRVFLLVCGDADRAGVKISVDELSCALEKMSSASELPVELAYLCDPEFPLHGWVSGQVKTGEGARLRLENQT